MSEEQFSIQGIQLDGMLHRSHIVPTNLYRSSSTLYTKKEMPELADKVAKKISLLNHKHMTPSFLHDKMRFSVNRFDEGSTQTPQPVLLRVRLVEHPMHIGFTRAVDDNDVPVFQFVAHAVNGPNRALTINVASDLELKHESKLGMRWELPLKWVLRPSSISISKDIDKLFPGSGITVDETTDKHYKGPVYYKEPSFYSAYHHDQTSRQQTSGFMEKKSSIEFGVRLWERFELGLESQTRYLLDSEYFASSVEYYKQDASSIPSSSSLSDTEATNDTNPQLTASTSPSSASSHPHLSHEDMQDYLKQINNGSRRVSFVARYQCAPVIAYRNVSTVSHYDITNRLSVGPDFSGVSSEFHLSERYHHRLFGFRWNINAGFVQSFRNLINYFIYGYHGENYLHLKIDEKYPHVPVHDRFFPGPESSVRGISNHSYGPKDPKTFKNAGGDSFFSIFTSIFLPQISKSEIQPYVFWNYSIFASLTHWLHSCYEPCRRKIEYYCQHASFGFGLVWPSKIGTFEVNYSTYFDDDGSLSPIVASYGGSIDW